MVFRRATKNNIDNINSNRYFISINYINNI